MKIYPMHTGRIGEFRLQEYMILEIFCLGFW